MRRVSHSCGKFNVQTFSAVFGPSLGISYNRNRYLLLGRLLRGRLSRRLCLLLFFQLLILLLLLNCLLNLLLGNFVVDTQLIRMRSC